MLGFAANPGNPHDRPFPGNGGAAVGAAPLYRGVLFPPNIDALLSGHNHVFEIVSFAIAHPPQFITGNGGDWADEPFPVPFPQGPSRRPARSSRDRVDDAIRLHDHGARRAAGRCAAWDATAAC